MLDMIPYCCRHVVINVSNTTLTMLTELVENSSVLLVIGRLTIIWLLLEFLFNLYMYYNVYFTNSSIDHRSLGKWAVITGATDGIGKGIAQELAIRGHDIVLVSRNPKKLETVANEFHSKYGVETKCIALDFTKCDIKSDGDCVSVYDVLEKELQGLEIGVLVNNVGMAAKIPEPFLNNLWRYGETFSDNIVNCNVTSMSKVTEVVLPGMVSRNKGVVINISSGLSSVIFPGMTLYSSSKRFNDTLPIALSHEYENKGIIVQSIQPGMVSTNMTRVVTQNKSSLTVPSPAKFASNLMSSIGKARMTRGYWIHAIQMSALSSIPSAIFSRAVKLIGHKMTNTALRRSIGLHPKNSH
uniref:very-long-chain 3-oxoacyl-CoA reductase-B-like n=1 Tax=Styela clava TaxID=7725 RepID=UPI00193A6620|nr:very-long-chain 3-oxoacyl-CoA reductase-B-like [Styela clava]